MCVYVRRLRMRRAAMSGRLIWPLVHWLLPHNCSLFNADPPPHSNKRKIWPLCLKWTKILLIILLDWNGLKFSCSVLSLSLSPMSLSPLPVPNRKTRFSLASYEWDVSGLVINFHLDYLPDLLLQFPIQQSCLARSFKGTCTLMKYAPTAAKPSLIHIRNFIIEFGKEKPSLIHK